MPRRSPAKRRYRLRPHLWLCLACLRDGRRDIYVDYDARQCPFGHVRKGKK